MYLHNISKEKEKEGIQRSYPLFKSVRVRTTNLDKIKARATRFNQTIDDLIGDMILKLDFYERQGYETRKTSGAGDK
jgi:hypothetical protein